MNLFLLKKDKLRDAVLVLTMSLYFGFNSFPQTPIQNFTNKQVFVEIAGIGDLYSLNYERQFLRKNDFRLLVHFGLGFIQLKDFTNTFNPDVVIPFALVANYGKKHHLEWGLGQTFSTIVQADIEKGGKQRQTGLSTQFIVGYRFQKRGRGLVYRLVYKPLIENNTYFRHWAGVSVGYAF